MSYAHEGDKRQKLIQWDEETIAEHDRERGSRQKIDEAPTPYRYQSESDQSECESGGSDGEGFKQKVRTNSVEDHYHHTSPPCKSNSVTDSWEAINAKLNYQKHLQDVSDGHSVAQDHYLNGGVGALGGSNGGEDEKILDVNPEFGEILESQMEGETVAMRNTRLNKAITASNSGQHSARNSMERRQHNSASMSVPNSTSSLVPPPPPPPSVFSHPSIKTGVEHLGKHSPGSCGSNSPIFTTHHHLHGAGTHLNAAATHPSSSSSSHTHHHSPHQIHFSNSPQISPHPSHNNIGGAAVAGGHVRNGSGDSAVGSLFAGINGSIGGSDSHTESNHINNSSNGNSSSVVSRAPFLNGIASSNGAAAGEEETEEELAQFRNKRAGHYNEYKVLQAMRAKLAAEEDSDEDDEPNK